MSEHVCTDPEFNPLADDVCPACELKPVASAPTEGREGTSEPRAEIESVERVAKAREIAASAMKRDRITDRTRWPGMPEVRAGERHATNVAAARPVPRARKSTAMLKLAFECLIEAKL